MSREIKFRAWDKEEKEYYYNAEYTYDFFCSGRGCYAESFGEVLNQSDRFIVEQYTGLKDKNGKEIYEGDIIRIPGEYALIVFDETKGSFMGRFFVNYKGQKIEYNDYIFAFCPDDIEVVGNEHENPELLGGEE